MGWSLGYDSFWERDIGYGVPIAGRVCHGHPGCHYRGRGLRGDHHWAKTGDRPDGHKGGKGSPPHYGKGGMSDETVTNHAEPFINGCLDF